MKKAIIAMLIIMLLIIVVFTSFGFAYSKNDFVSTMLKVEHGLGDTSDKVMTTYTKTKSLAEQIGKVVNRFVNFGDLFNRFYSSSLRLLEETSCLVSFVPDYFNSGKLFDSCAVLFRCFSNDEFWDNDFNFDYSRAKSLIDAYLFEADNEYTYKVKQDLIDSLTLISNSSIKNTYFIYRTPNHRFSSTPCIDDCLAWFQSVDLSVDDKYLFYENDFDRRYLLYENKEFFISKTNIEYTFTDGTVVKAHRFRITRASLGQYDINYYLFKKNSESLFIFIDGIPYTVEFGFFYASNPDSTGELVWLDGAKVIKSIENPDLPWLQDWFGLGACVYTMFPTDGLYERDDISMN